VGYLEWLLEGDDYFMGSNGSLFKRGPCGDSCCSTVFKPGLFEDCLYFLFNNHGFLSTMFAEVDHPYSRSERNFSFLALNCLTYFGVAVGTFISTNQTYVLIWKVGVMGVLQYLFTNVFQGLFSCQCLLSTKVGVETKLEYFIRRAIEILGTMTGSLLAVLASGMFLIGATRICPDEGKSLLPFAIRTQLSGIIIGIVFPMMQYIPLVLHFSGMPIMGDMVLSGSWYLEKYQETKVHRDAWMAQGLHTIEKKDFYYLQIDFRCSPRFFSTDVDRADLTGDDEEVGEDKKAKAKCDDEEEDDIVNYFDNTEHKKMMMKKSAVKVFPEEQADSAA
jgi:hypothetical protein